MTKPMTLPERLRAEASDKGSHGFQQCWTPELLIEAADEINRLAEQLAIRDAYLKRWVKAFQGRGHYPYHETRSLLTETDDRYSATDSIDVER